MELHFYPDIEIEAMLYGLCSGTITHEVRCAPDLMLNGDIYVGPVTSLKDKNRILLNTGNVFSNFIGPSYYYNEESDYVNIKDNDAISEFYANIFLKKKIMRGTLPPVVINHHAEFINLSMKEIKSKNKIEIFKLWSNISGDLPLPLYVSTVDNESENRKDYFENLLKKSIKFLHENVDLILKDLLGSIDLRKLNLEKMAVLNFINKASYEISDYELDAIRFVSKYI